MIVVVLLQAIPVMTVMTVQELQTELLLKMSVEYVITMPLTTVNRIVLEIGVEIPL